MARSIRELVMQYFKERPYAEHRHGPVVDWVSQQYEAETGRRPRDPWRVIRKLHQDGMLIKVDKGIYKYDPELERDETPLLFTPKTRGEIFKRDGYRCVVCGLGRRDGVELAADHIVPKDRGGTNDVENGQTLCSHHMPLKRNSSQSEAGKRYFIKMYEKAVSVNDEKMKAFCEAVFDVYDEHGMNGHIDRPDLESGV